MPTNAHQREITRLDEQRLATTEIGPGVFIQLPTTYECREYEPGVTVRFTLGRPDEGGPVVATSVTADCSTGIGGTLLRRVQVATLVRDAVARYAMVGTAATEHDPAIGLDVTEVHQAPVEIDETAAMRMRLDGPTPDNLQVVARLYRVAEALQQGPTRHVASAIGLPISTAGFWVRKARDFGLLPEVDR